MASSYDSGNCIVASLKQIMRQTSIGSGARNSRQS